MTTIEALEGRLMLSAAVERAETSGTTVPPATTVPVTPKPKKPRPIINSIPGVVQAEKYGISGEGADYHDLTPRNMGKKYRTTDRVDIGSGGSGYYVGWTQAGEWLQYTINSTRTMTHTLTARVASKGVGGKFHLLIDGKTKIKAARVPDTGNWGIYRTISMGTVRLKKGLHTVRLVMDSVGVTKMTGRFDWIGFSAPAPAAPKGLSAAALSDSAIQLSWIDASTDEDFFRIERASAFGGPWQQIGLAPANVPAFLDQSVTSNSTFFYRVRATSSLGDSAYSGVANATTPYSSPITITSGGIYRGNWMSTNPAVAAITIATDEPVVIENSVIRSSGNLIQTTSGAANVTVRNISGYSSPATTAGRHAGRFFYSDGFASVNIQNNYLEGTSGIYLANYAGDSSANQTVRITRNQVRNIDGRLSNGAGLFTNAGDDDPGTFVQVRDAMGLRNAEIAWNEVINEPWRSGVKDNISIRTAGGAADSYLLIHDNYIQGAYPADPVYDAAYTGGGIMLGDDGSAYVRAYSNHVVDTVSYGIGIVSGHHNEFHDNRILASGMLTGGWAPAAQGVGAYIRNVDGEAGFANNRGMNNLIGWMDGGVRNDVLVPDASEWTGNQPWADPVITTQITAAEYTVWRNKLSANGVAVGLINDNVHNPIVITSGGTYSGIYQSLDATVPAITIATSEPVIIENSRIRSRGTLIQSYENSADLTIRNNVGYGLDPMVYGRYAGRFLDLEGFVSLTVDNNYIESTSGIYIYAYRGNQTAAQTMKVRRNIVKNIEGRRASGLGGWLGGSPDADNYKQFLQINGVHGLAGAEIAWNQIINELGHSRTEENISIHNSSGQPGDPLRIHNNYIQGAYPTDAVDALISTAGAIMLSDNGSSYVYAYDNQAVNTGTVGIAITSGHDNAFYHNRIISSGTGPDGQLLTYSNVGAVIWNYNNEPTFANNIGYGNTIGWVAADGTRNDEFVPDAAAWFNNILLPDPITKAMEAQEYVLWKQKLTSNGIALGPTQY